ncbi:MAG: YitT family protein [Acutalibacter sp.]|jgi:uncharacterized membrane-anchored protein YitT (DUF2179 family)
MKKLMTKDALKRGAWKLALVLAGNTLYALGVALFLLPTGLITGGTTGLGLVADHFFHVPLTVFVAVFNLAMFLVGLLVLGKVFALTTVISSFYYPFILEVIQRTCGEVQLTDDPLLATILAGLMIGAGIGMVIRAGASTGGMDIPPLVLQKKLNIPVSLSLYVFDCGILLLQALFSNVEQVLYGLVLVLLYTLTLNKALLLGRGQMQLKVVSSRYEEISREIQQRMDRGVTLFTSVGGYAGQEGATVLTVVDRRELPKVTELVSQLDPNAFMVVSQVNEVRGRGFTLPKRYVG